eukprot:9020819-Alexandrium_andersonii.AAC.1
MSASLVGSEMCIRDSALPQAPAALGPVELRAPQAGEDRDQVVQVLGRVDWRRHLEVEIVDAVRGRSMARS